MHFERYKKLSSSQKNLRPKAFSRETYSYSKFSVDEFSQYRIQKVELNFKSNPFSIGRQYCIYSETLCVWPNSSLLNFGSFSSTVFSYSSPSPLANNRKLLTRLFFFSLSGGCRHQPRDEAAGNLWLACCLFFRCMRWFIILLFWPFRCVFGAGISKNKKWAYPLAPKSKTKIFLQGAHKVWGPKRS